MKKWLEHMSGIDVFVAPRDLKPSRKQWQNMIVEKIRECDVFLALMTTNFGKSEYTNQEAGMAIAFRKLPIPLRVGSSEPTGFLRNYQYQDVKLSSKLLGKSCCSILKTITNDRKLADKLRWTFICALNSSENFDESRDRSELLEALGPYSAEQINRILKGTYKALRFITDSQPAAESSTC